MWLAFVKPPRRAAVSIEAAAVGAALRLKSGSVPVRIPQGDTGRVFAVPPFVLLFVDCDANGMNGYIYKLLHAARVACILHVIHTAKLLLCLPLYYMYARWL